MSTVRVVIPTYNRAHIVGEALESVLTQTFADFEVVVVDDGSTDDTATVVRQFVCKDSRVHFHQLAHGGAAQARNAGISADGQYTYLAFLDSDDLWVPCHLEKAIETLIREPTAAVFFARVDLAEMTGKGEQARLQARQERIRTPARVSDRLLDQHIHFLDARTCRQGLLLGKFAVIPSSAVVRAEMVERTDWFNTTLEIFEDLEFFLYIARNGNAFIFDDVPHAQMRRFGDNLTGEQDLQSPIVLRRLRSALSYTKTKLSFCTCDEEVSYVSREIADMTYLIGQCCTEQKKWQEACSAYQESFKHRFSYKVIKSFFKARMHQIVS